MLKIEKIQIIKNVGSSWFALGVNVLVGFFLSPFILHRLGDAAFGIWVLIRSSIIRYVSKYTATRDLEEVTGLLNTAMFTYICVAAFSMLLTVVGCIYIDRLFRIQPGFYSTARWLLLVVGTSVALGFPLGIFGGILEGLQKFYLLNWTNIGFSSILRVVLIVYYLNRGYGLLTVALITVGLPVLGSAVRAVVALRSIPLRFSWKYVHRDAFRHMANYSGVTFMIIVGSRLRFKTDALVIGTFISSAAITYFYAGSRLLDYAGEVVSSLAQIFVPMSSQSDAAGNLNRLRKIFVVGNRACAFTTLPITAIFIILGKSLIEVWVGKRYVAQGYPILLILTIPYTLMLVQSASGRILFGMGKHAKLAVVTMIEGVANLALSIMLVRPYGIMGDAIGTAIPLAGTFLAFMPFHLCSLLGIRMGTYLRQAYVLPLILCAPMAAVLVLMQHYWGMPHTYRQLAVQLLAGGLTYVVCVGWAYATDRALHVVELVPSAEKLVSEVSPLAANFEVNEGDL
jgi:O-antigen/teichoic acid export membrane protein